MAGVLAVLKTFIIVAPSDPDEWGGRYPTGGRALFVRWETPQPSALRLNALMTFPRQHSEVIPTGYLGELGYTIGGIDFFREKTAVVLTCLAVILWQITDFTF